MTSLSLYGIPPEHWSSSPVRILIDGVYLQVEPVDLASLSPETIKESILANKFHRLTEAEKLYQAAAESEEALSYFQRLSAKIIGKAVL